MKPLLAVSLGCPSGIGPEVAVAAALTCKVARVLLVGDAGVVARAARGLDVDPRRLIAVEDGPTARRLRGTEVGVLQVGPRLAARDVKAGAPSPRGGAAQLAWIDDATDRVLAGEADALVTGPVSKASIAASGASGASSFLGHTEHLQRRTRAKEVVMAFWSRELTTALATTHLALADVPRRLRAGDVARATYWLAWLLHRLERGGGKGRGARAQDTGPRVAVAALNPHAGEGGLLGREETTRVVPGIVAARARLAKAGLRATVTGPVPAESAFRLAVAGAFDGVVAMYHDQGTIPMKLVGFGEAVNVSLGLPLVRTSVDHGTAYDRAGSFTADPRGMAEALALAARLARRPGAG